MSQAATVLNFFRPNRPKDWSQPELAEFYRVESALIQSGLTVWTDRGLSDEGDPWFVFGRQDNEEVIAHFARIAGQYVVASSVSTTVVQGPDFRALISELLNAHPYVMSRSVARRGGNVYLHPSALLVALLATAFAQTSELQDNHNFYEQADSKGSWSLLHRFEIAIISAIALVISSVDQASDFATTKAELLALLEAADDGHNATFVVDHAVDSSSASQNLANDLAQVFQTHDQTAYDDHHQALTAEVTDRADDVGHLINVSNPQNFHIDALSDTLAKSHVGEDARGFLEFSVPQDGNGAFVSAGGFWSVYGLSASAGDFSDSGAALKLSVDNIQNTSGFWLTGSLVHQSDATMMLSLSVNAVQYSSNTATTLESAVSFSLVYFGYTAEITAKLVDELSASHGLVPSSGVSNVADTEGPTQAPVTLGTPAVMAPTIAFLAPGTVDVASYGATAQASIAEFIHDTPQLKIAVLDNDVVLVDANVAHMSDANFGLMSWVMPDHSTVTIVGIMPTEPHMT